MGAVHFVCAVATQGSTGNHWVRSFKLHLSLDGATFNVYKENNAEKVRKITEWIAPSLKPQMNNIANSTSV